MKDTNPLRPPRAAHAEPPAHAPNAALLIDFDNVTLSIRSDLSSQLRRLLNSDIFKGKVSVQRAYADWRRYPQYIVPLSEASIDLIFAPAFGSNKKNATDIRLAIDALELVFTRPEIGTFILLSGDSDFSSLVLKLKEYGKYVIGVGMRESSSDLLVQNCDEYFSYSELTGLTRQGDLEHPHRDPWELVVEAVTQMKRDDDVMRSDRLKQVMQQMDPNFDEKEVGFNRFSKFALEASQRGLLRLTKLDNGQYQIDLGPNANVPPGPDGEVESEEAHREERKRPPRRARAPKPGGLTLAGAFDLLRQTLGTLATPGEPVDAQSVRTAMQERAPQSDDPIFERNRFQRLLRQAHDASAVELAKQADGTYVLTLTEAPLEASAAAAEAEPSASAEEAPKRQRGRRGGRGGRGSGRRHQTDAAREREDEGRPETSEGSSAPAVPESEPVTGRTAQRNPRYRRGSRGASAMAPPPPTTGERGPVAQLEAEGQARAEGTPTVATTPAPRSVGPRSGSRGGRRAPATATPEPTAGSETPPLVAARDQDRAAASEPAQMPAARPAFTAPAPSHPADLTEPGLGGDESPSFLKRMTAALQRAVRGPEPPEE